MSKEREIGAPFQKVLSMLFGLALVALALVIPEVKAQTWNWQIETVDSSGRFPSVAVDKQGNIHVSYVREGKGVMYAFRPAGVPQWFKLVVDGRGGPAGETTSIALDPRGNPHICFTPGPIKYSSFDGHDWKTEFIGTNAVFLEYTCSVAISQDGTPHVIWYQTHNPDTTAYNHLRYAVKQDGIWLVRTVDFDFETGKWNSISLDEAGNPHLSYSGLAGGELRYATLQSDKWNINIIDSRKMADGTFNHGFGNSIILDRDGHPEISYYTDIALKLARKVEGRWKTEVVDRISGSTGWSGYKSSLLVDSHGTLHICYEDAGAVKHAVWDGERWQIQLITRVGTQSRWPAMTIDAKDNLYIAFRDAEDDSLKVGIGRPLNVSEKNRGPSKGEGNH
jgi:sugar lactone lactonase YvrE